MKYLLAVFTILTTLAFTAEHPVIALSAVAAVFLAAMANIGITSAKE